MNEELLGRYAEVTVRVGANLQPGQLLVVDSTVEAVPLARAIAEAGWRAGAGDVQMHYRDDYERFLLARHAPDDALARSNVAHLALLRHELDSRPAAVTITGDAAPRYFAAADAERLARTRPREERDLVARLLNELREAWVVVAYPEPSWAERVFGEPDVERLFDEVAHACRLHDHDPVASWRAHLDALEERRRLLDERRFDRLRFRGPGTDLTVGLLPTSGWLGGYSRTAWGHVFCANLPTEEVFTTPHRLRTEGTVRATRPVAYAEGVLVDGIELRFSGGRVVEARAAAGEEFLRRHLETDAGAPFLGEVALVAGSRIGARGLLFSNTLFDENATSHLAYGMAYTEAVEGAAELDPAARVELGLNDSLVHTDFPVGGAGVEVDGYDPRGERVAVLRGDDWLLE